MHLRDDSIHLEARCLNPAYMRLNVPIQRVKTALTPRTPEKCIVGESSGRSNAIRRTSRTRRQIAKQIDIRAGQRVLYIRRLILVEGKPLLYHWEYVIYDPKRPIVESEMEVITLKGLFEGNGHSVLKKSKLSIEASVISPEEAQLLQITPGAPAFRLEHVFFDFEDRPVSWGCFICPGSLLKFEATVGSH